VVSGANFLLDVIPYRHPEAAQILGGRYTALCQALVLTSENDFGTMYRPGFASPRGSSALLGRSRLADLTYPELRCVGPGLSRRTSATRTPL
jgi:hypothetical protein